MSIANLPTATRALNDVPSRASWLMFSGTSVRPGSSIMPPCSASTLLPSSTVTVPSSEQVIRLTVTSEVVPVMTTTASLCSTPARRPLLIVSK